MAKKEKYIKYFINGKEVDKKTIQKRKGKLFSVVVVEKKYYEAPLTEQEKEERTIAAKNASKFFNELRETREDQEKYHG
jgi:hypothetical protein